MTMDTPTLSALSSASLAELEAIYASDRPVALPEGCYRGIHLRRLATPGANKLVNRLPQYIGFEATPFGIDFDRACWFFFSRRLRAGRFTAAIAPSRWRPTQTVTLDYAASRLPAPLRAVLYDEVKPLSESLCLGLGGTNADRDHGDHFFFALERI
jgi:hypothetical protein